MVGMAGCHREVQRGRRFGWRSHLQSCTIMKSRKFYLLQSSALREPIQPVLPRSSMCVTVKREWIVHSGEFPQSFASF